MDTLETLLKRQSCRSYSDKAVPEELIDKIVLAGEYAPTGMGKQSPKIVVVENKQVRDQLSNMNKAILGADHDPFYGAPVVIVVLAEPSIATYIADGALVIGNMLNAAYSLGLGSCWIARAKEEFNSPEGKELLKAWNIPTNYVGIGHMVLGYANSPYQARAERKEDYVIKIK